VKSGGGAGSVTYWISYWDSGKPLALAPRVGDRVTISIYYDRAADKSHFTAVNLRTGRKATASLGGLMWTQAWVMGGGPGTLATSKTPSPGWAAAGAVWRRGIGGPSSPLKRE
jgi:hypothetical protein